MSWRIKGVKGFGFETFCRAMVTEYQVLKEFTDDNPFPHPDALKKLSEEWETIPKLTFPEVMREPNLEKRRALFSCMNTEELFKSCKTLTKLDSKIVKKSQTKWDENEKPYTHNYIDKYDLYSIKREELIPHKEEEKQTGVRTWDADKAIICVVHCKCPSTDRDYWIMVNERDCTVRNGIGKVEFHAIKAIASTIRIREKNPKRIIRQGDIIVVEVDPTKPDDHHWSPQPLSIEQYLNMYSET
jgi:hypothetical protein